MYGVAEVDAVVGEDRLDVVDVVATEELPLGLDHGRLRSALTHLRYGVEGSLRDVERLLVYHNPSCSKSRGALDILADRGVDHDVVEYLRAPPDRATLERIVDAVDAAPAELIRQDKRFEELDLSASDYATRDAVIELLLEHPELMQRPVIFRGERAVIARPSEKVLELLD